MGKKKALFFGNRGVEIPTNNLVAYLPFNNNVDDATGNHIPTAVAVSYVDGLYSGNPNEAIEFPNLIQTIVKIPDADDLSFGNGIVDEPFSISFIMNADNLGIESGTYYLKYLLTKRNDFEDGGREYLLTTSNDTNRVLRILLFDESEGGRIGVESTTQLNNNTNYHIVITYDGSGNSSGLCIYINSVKEPYNDFSSGIYVAMENLDAPISIANWQNLVNVRYDGRLDGLGMWNIELTQEQVTNIYNKQLNGQELL